MHAWACDVMGKCIQYMHVLACDMHASACAVTSLMHALTTWDLKFQVCLGYTFTPATLVANSVALLSLNSLIVATTKKIIYIRYHIMGESQGMQYHHRNWVHVCPLNSDNINTALNYGQLS